MSRFLPLIIKNSLRNRRRSVLTIGSMAVSLCLLGVLFAIYRVLFLAPATPDQALRLVVRHRVSLTQSLPIAYQQQIERVPGVRQVMAWQWFGGTYKDNRDPANFFARFGAQPDRLFSVMPELQIPADQKAAFQNLRTGAIVSQSVVDKLHFKVGDRITLVGDIFPVTLELTVVGIFDRPEHDETLYFNRDYLRDALGPATTRANQVSMYLVQANTAEDVPRAAQAIDALFDNAPAPTKSESERAFALSFANFVGNLRLFLLLICGAVTFTILLVSANTISMSVRERVREVGILKTLGFTQGNILGIILGEAGFIAFIGGVLGCVLAQFLSVGVSHSPMASFMQDLKQLTLTPSLVAICLGVALLIGLVSSLIPAWGAARTTILDALRSSA